MSALALCYKDASPFALSYCSMSPWLSASLGLTINHGTRSFLLHSLDALMMSRLRKLCRHVHVHGTGVRRSRPRSLCTNQCRLKLQVIASQNKTFLARKLLLCSCHAE